jgi:hypothetical protein
VPGEIAPECAGFLARSIVKRVAENEGGGFEQVSTQKSDTSISRDSEKELHESWTPGLSSKEKALHYLKDRKYEGA